jgi:hypothetical protein
MTTRDILSKLGRELYEGIATEAQVVYVLAGVRKLMERDGVKKKYPTLNFHCDWALHSKLEGPGATRVLREFDVAHPLLREGAELHQLPHSLNAEIDRIVKMRSFREELDQFLKDYDLPRLSGDDRDEWPHFLYLYAKVIEDIPLVVVRKRIPAAQHISQVVVRFDEANEPIGGEALFRVTWTVHDKNGQSGSIEIYNSYSR